MDNQERREKRQDKEIYQPKKRGIGDLGLEEQFAKLATGNGEEEFKRNNERRRGRGRGGRGGRGRGGGGVVHGGYNQNHADNRDNRGENRETQSNGHKFTFNPNAAQKTTPRKENKFTKTIKGKNTTNFNREFEPADMLVNFVSGNLSTSGYNRPLTSRDVIVVNDLFCMQDDLSIYNLLLDEIQSSGVEKDDLFKLWHGDSHLIADDKTHWKNCCPTFKMVLDKATSFFGMDVKATRFNWYRDSNDWKPFHHDAAAVKEDKAKTQNLTIAISFGMERQVAFEHAKTRTRVAMNQPNGTIYTFGKDVNIMWKHGIPAVHPDQYKDQGRISIIAWGWVDNVEEFPM